MPTPVLSGPTPPTAKPTGLPPLRYPADVTARMKATGVDAEAAEKRLAALPRDQAETTWANVTDTYRHNTDLSSKVAAYQGADKTYQQARMRQPDNPAWTAWDDLGSTFKNSFVDLAQGVTDFIPSVADLSMSIASNPSDDSWYRKWDKATDDYFQKAKYYVSPEAQAAIYDDKTGLNWRAVAGMMGSTAGFLTTTMLPFVGVLGRAGLAAEGLSAGSAAMRVLTDPRIQAGAIGYLQTLPGYKEQAIKAGYTRNQAAIIAPVLSAAQAALEFVGGDFLMKGASKLSAKEASQVVRQLGNQSANDAFQSLAGKPLTEETFRDVINLTGKGFFSRLKQPEAWQGLWNAIKTGAVPEAAEELMQGGSEAAIQKMADIYYGYGKMGDQTQDGKGFDPTVVGTAIQSATGMLMGGIVGGSMGGMFHTPTSVSQQTIWGKLDSDVRDLLAKTPDADLSQARQSLPLYRLAEKQRQEGRLTDGQYQQAVAGMDRMVGVSQKLAGSRSDAATRFALYNLDNEQQNWQGRVQSEVQAPMARLQELADERAPGQWYPKPGLSSLDLYEAGELINQNLPRKVQLAGQITDTINSAISSLSNPATRQQTLRSYRATLDGLASQWDTQPTVEQAAPSGPDTFAESERPDVYETLDTPDGRFALADNPQGGRQVLRVETQTEGQQSGVSEESDPVVGRFKSYKLPSKGQPVVSLHTISDQTRHDQLLDAFDQNRDLVEPYSNWRNRLSDQYADNSLDGLRQAESLYQQQAKDLPADAPDWQRQDLARKRDWLKGKLASAASNPDLPDYNWQDWTNSYLANELAEAGIKSSDIANLTPPALSAVSDALQSGDYAGAKRLVKQYSTAQTSIFDESLPTRSGTDALSAEFTAATERSELLTTTADATQQVLDGASLIEQIEQAALAGQLTADSQQQLMDAISQLAGALDAEYAGFTALDSAESGNPGGTETGAGQTETAGDPASGDGTESTIPEFSPENAEAPLGSNAVDRPAKRSTKSENTPVVRQPRDLHEAVLQYFDAGGRIRRSDLARYADPNVMKDGRGGNPYLRYTTGDDKVPSLDNLAHAIAEEGLGLPNGQFDEQAIMQAIVDTVLSFSQGSPRQQLVAYQQAQTEAENAQNDQLVAEATARTPIQLMEPLMVGMDQAGVPVGIQDQLLRLVADHYITASGLDWVGVIQLLQANDVFDRYAALRPVLWPLLDEIARQVPVTQAEYAERAGQTGINQQGEQMSADAWEALAQQQQLTSSEYTELTNLFYGSQPTTQSTASQSAPVNGPAARSANPAGENAGLFSSGDESSSAGGPDAPTDRLGSDRTGGELTPVQQQRIDQASAQVEADIAATQKERDQLQAQVQTLRNKLGDRLQTDDLFEASPTSTAYQSALAHFQQAAQRALEVYTNGVVAVPHSTDRLLIQAGQVVGVGYMNGQQFVPLPTPIAQYLKQNPSAARAFTQTLQNNQQNLTLATSPELADLVRQLDGLSRAQGLELIKSAPTPLRRMLEGLSGTVRSQQTAQPVLAISEPVTGAQAHKAVREKLLDLEAELAATQDKLTNLQASRQQAQEVALAAPVESDLFPAELTPASITSQTIDTENEALAVEAAEKPAPEEPEILSAEQQAEADEVLERLADFGQKIGGARKDTAERGGKTGRKGTGSGPGWARKYKVFADKNGTFQIARVSGHLMKTLKRGFATEQQAYASIPLVEVASNHRVYQKGDGAYSIYRVFSSGKVWDVQDGFTSREGALAYMAQHAEALIGRKSLIERPHLETIERQGTDYRRGKHVTTQLLLDTFGFRGGEFGNWLAADERQQVLNLAYDAFMDLAQVLHVPPRALSLGGELSIGFGSRGKGLSAGAAHYEPARAVINLTRIKGAGSLAHEWFHALDNFLAKQDGKASALRREDGTFEVSSKERAYFSHGNSSVRSGVRAELADAFNRVWKAISEKRVERIIDVEKTGTQLQKTREALQNGLADLRARIAVPRTYGKSKKAASAEQLAQFDRLAGELTNADPGERKWYAREKSRFNGDYYYPLEKELYELVKQVTGSKVGDYLSVSPELVRYSRALAEHSRATGGQRQMSRVKTDFAVNAQKLDVSRASPYWSTPHELMARAFEAFVQDQISQRGDASQYLIHGAENGFYALFDEKPYPEGQERVDSNQAFANLIHTIDTRTHESGVIILAESDPTYAQHLTTSYGSPAAFRQTTQRLFNGLKNQVLLESLLPAGGAADPGSLSGLRPHLRQRTVLAGFEETGYVAYQGTRVNSHADLVDLFQIHRSPLIEKGHVVLLKNGVIVGNVAITAGLPAATSFGQDHFVQSLVDGYGADGYYLLHNHPSGNHQVSAEDLAASARLSQTVSVPLLGSVVIDTTKYSVIDHRGQVTEHDYRQAPPVLYGERVNIRGDSPEVAGRHMAIVAKALLKDAAYDHVLVGLDASLGVAGYDVLDDVHNLAGRSQQLAQATGASRFVLVSTARSARSMPDLPANFMDYIVVDEQSRVVAPGFVALPYNENVSYMVSSPTGRSLTRDFRQFDPAGMAAPLVVREPLTELIYPTAPVVSGRPTRPLANTQAADFDQLAQAYSPAGRKALLSLPVSELVATLKGQWQPLIGQLLQLAPNSKVVASLQKQRVGGSLINPQGELNESFLRALATELKAAKPKGSDATGRLRDLLWGTSNARPDLLAAYQQTIQRGENLLIDEDGNYQGADLAGEQLDLAQALERIDPERLSGPAKYLGKLLTAKFSSNLFLPETVGHLLSGDAGSAIRRITKTIRRVYVERASEVMLTRQRQLSELTEKLAGLSLFDGRASATSVKTLHFEGWIDGKQTQVQLPVGAWLDVYRTVKTQLASAGSSSVLADLSATGRLIPQRVGLDAAHQPATSDYGWVYLDPAQEASVPQTILLSAASFTELEKTLRSDYAEVLSAVEDFFGYAVATEYLSDIHRIVSAEPFVFEADYYPTASYQPAGKRQNVGGGRSLLTEARILQTRKTPPLRVTGQDVLARLEAYSRQEQSFIESAVTIENLRRWRARHAETLDKTAWTRQWVVPYLDQLEKDLNNPLGQPDRGDALSEFKLAGIDVGLKAWVKRLTRSTFGANLTMPIKQLSTYLNLFHAGVLERPYILKAGNELLRLGLDAYRPARQLSGTDLLGHELAEVAYLKEIAANPYAATLLARILGQSDAYLGAPSVDDFAVNAKDASVQALRKGIHEIADVALRGMRAADRANLIVTYLAAKYQVEAEIADGRFGPSNPDAALRRIAELATEAMYVTNQMAAQSDQTPLARSRSFFALLVGLYSGQQQRLLNSVLTAAADYIHAPAGAAKQQALSQLLWRGGNMIVLNAVLMGLINALWRALTGALTGEENKAPLESLAWDVSRNILTTFPSVPTEALAVLTTRFDSAPWSDEFLSYPAGDSFGQLVSGLEAGYQAVGEDDPKRQARQLNTMSRNLITSTTRLLGLPSTLPRLLVKATQTNGKAGSEADGSPVLPMPNL